MVTSLPEGTQWVGAQLEFEHSGLSDSTPRMHMDMDSGPSSASNSHLPTVCPCARCSTSLCLI